MEGEGVERGVEEGVRRRRGLGNVLCVDPNEVYLASGGMRSSASKVPREIVREDSVANSPIIVQFTPIDFPSFFPAQRQVWVSQELPDFRIGPIEDWMNSDEVWPGWISWIEWLQGSYSCCLSSVLSAREEK